MKGLAIIYFIGGVLGLTGLLFLGILFNSLDKRKFVPNPKYCDTVYLKPDSSFGYIKFFGIIKSKDTSYFYGIEKDSNGIIIRKLIYEKDIFGQKKED